MTAPVERHSLKADTAVEVKQVKCATNFEILNPQDIKFGLCTAFTTLLLNFTCVFLLFSVCIRWPGVSLRRQSEDRMQLVVSIILL